MDARREPIPAVQVEAEKNRLQEEGEALKREHQPEYARPKPHEARPQQTKLERKRCAGDSADDEENARSTAPSARQCIPGGVALAQADALRDAEHDGQTDAKRSEDDVKRQ